MKRSDTLAFLAQRRRDEIVVTTMSAFLEWPQYSSHPWDLVDGDTMGAATPVGLGLALAQPDRPVWVFHGDGSQLMNLGSLVTAGSVAPPNLYIFIFRNNCYEITGGQPIPGLTTMRFTRLAEGAGFKHTHEFERVEDLVAHFDEIVSRPGPALIDLWIEGR